MSVSYHFLFVKTWRTCLLCPAFLTLSLSFVKISASVSEFHEKQHFPKYSTLQSRLRYYFQDVLSLFIDSRVSKEQFLCDHLNVFKDVPINIFR